MEAMLVKAGNAFYAATDHDRAQFSKVPNGECVKVKWTRPRNIQFHRKFWALAQIAFDHSESRTLDEFVEALKIAVGHFDTIVLLDGNIHLKPRSISFAAMKEDEFADFYSKCLDAILSKVMPGTDQQALEEMVMRFM